MGQPGMALAPGLVHHVDDSRLGAAGGIPGYAQLGGDQVRGAEADALDVHRQPVGIVLEGLHRADAVGGEDPLGEEGGDSHRVQEHHHLALDLLLLPGLHHFPVDLAGKLGYLQQLFRFVVDDLEGFVTEDFHDALSQLFADPLDVGLQVALDALQAGGLHHQRGLHGELGAVGGVILPDAPQLEGLALPDIAQHALHRDQLFLLLGQQAPDDEPILLVGEGDPLQHAHHGFLAPAPHLAGLHVLQGQLGMVEGLVETLAGRIAGCSFGNFFGNIFC